MTEGDRRLPAAAVALNAITRIQQRRSRGVDRVRANYRQVPRGFWKHLEQAARDFGASAARFDLADADSRTTPSRPAAQREGFTATLPLRIGTGRNRTALGEFAIDFPSRPSGEELDALRVVVAALADELSEGLEWLAADRARSTSNRVRELASARPGTAISRAVQAMHHLVGAHHSAYLSVDGQQSALEYYKRSRWRENQSAAHTTSPSVFVLPPTLVEILQRLDPTLWQDAKGELRDILARAGLDETLDDCQYLLQPVHGGGDVVGFFAFALERHTPLFLQHEAPALIECAAVLASPCILIFQRRFRALILEPIFRGRDTRIDDELIFVLMPFTLPWSDRIWTKIMRPTIAGLGLRAIRADDLFGRDVMEDIWGELLRARLVIADITSRNANVFYELGLAHAVGKEVVLTTQATSDIPFDLNRFRHIIYSDNYDGYEVLRRELIATVNHILR